MVSEIGVFQSIEEVHRRHCGNASWQQAATLGLTSWCPWLVVEERRLRPALAKKNPASLFPRGRSDDHKIQDRTGTLNLDSQLDLSPFFLQSRYHCCAHSSSQPSSLLSASPQLSFPLRLSLLLGQINASISRRASSQSEKKKKPIVGLSFFSRHEQARERSATDSRPRSFGQT
jgi:hypothetical protein